MSVWTVGCSSHWWLNDKTVEEEIYQFQYMCQFWIGIEYYSVRYSVCILSASPSSMCCSVELLLMGVYICLYWGSHAFSYSTHKISPPWEQRVRLCWLLSSTQLPLVYTLPLLQVACSFKCTRYCVYIGEHKVLMSPACLTKARATALQTQRCARNTSISMWDCHIW